MKITYEELRDNPPNLWVADGAKEVIIHTTSCMCDNKALLRLKKNSDNEFKLNSPNWALSNWQFRCEIYEIEWMADEGNWSRVFELINTGTSLISEVRSR
jgi:nuclear transport factor 2 (NTF2) superfamily protein